MIFSSCLVEYDNNEHNKLLELIGTLANVEVHYDEPEKGRMIVVIEGENNADLEAVEKLLKSQPFVDDFNYYAFNFEEEVDKVLAGGPVPDFSLEKPFNMQKQFLNLVDIEEEEEENIK